MQKIMELCVTSLALDNWEQKKIVQLLAMSQTIHSVCCEDNYFPKEKFKLFNSLFHSVYLVFTKVCFLLYCRFVCRALSVGRMWRRQMLCCDTARRRHSRRSACLRSHVLRAYCNCESKQANSITRFGRGPNKKHLLALLGPVWVILLDLWDRY